MIGHGFQPYLTWVSHTINRVSVIWYEVLFIAKTIAKLVFLNNIYAKVKIKQIKHLNKMKINHFSLEKVLV